MAIASDLFVAHRNIVTARIGFQNALGLLLEDLPSRAAEAGAVKAAWLASRGSSRLALEAVCQAERSRRGEVVRLGSRRRRGR
jgi:hypothetical protein